MRDYYLLDMWGNLQRFGDLKCLKRWVLGIREEVLVVVAFSIAVFLWVFDEGIGASA